jgi:MoaA/NifB/PqqE/SkfB family radical SAM enzyme
VARKAGRFKEEDEIPDDIWLKFVDEAIEFGANDWLILGGGEPWLRGNLILQILRKIKKGIESPYVEIFTNGTLFREEEIKMLVELGTSRITFSVHDLNDGYVELTGATSKIFEKVRHNLKLFKQAKDELKKSRPQIQINMVVNKKNYRRLPQLVEFAKEVGANILALHPMRGFEETKEVVSPYELSQEILPELRKLIENARKSCEKAGIVLDTSPLEAVMPIKEGAKLEGINSNEGELKDLLKLRCYEPWYGMLINPDGQVGRCSALIFRDEPLNIREMSLKKIWNSDFLNIVRESVLQGKLLKGCEQCGLLSTTATLKRAFRIVEQWLKGERDLDEIKSMLEEVY